MKNNVFTWIIKLTAVVILVQTLFFKFTGAEESPRTTVLGAVLGMGVMAGAIVSHLFILGIDVQNDGGLLFTLAIVTFVCCAILVFQGRDKIYEVLKFKF